MSNIYYNEARVRGKCSICGDQKEYRQTKHPKYLKPWYLRVFEKVDWFRGNDEYLGMICKQCVREGKLVQVNKGQV